MAGMTNRGKYEILECAFRGAQSYYVVLVTSAVVPSADTNTLSDLTQIAGGNGYTTGGYSLTGNSTDFDTLTEDDSNDRAYIQIKDIGWTASGGAIPASGSAARYAVLLDSGNNVISYWDLGGEVTILTGNTYNLQNLQIEIGE